MISDSVTHLLSYTNSAIAENSAPISPVTPRDRRRPPAECRRLRIERRRLRIERRRLRIERRLRRIEWPPRDRRRLRTERRYRRIEWRVFEWFMMFHNVLRVFHDVLLVVYDVLLVVHDVLLVVHDVSLVVHDVSLVVHDVSRCFTCVLCFTMFNNVLWCLASRATTGSTHRFGKNTHIYMITISVAHLRSYTNSAIAGNSATISPVTPRDRRRRRAKRRRLLIERRRLRIVRRYCRIEWRLFHDVSQCFKCFMMFY